jgi:hypothetical protein
MMNNNAGQPQAKTVIGEKRYAPWRDEWTYDIT